MAKRKSPGTGGSGRGRTTGNTRNSSGRGPRKTSRTDRTDPGPRRSSSPRSARRDDSRPDKGPGSKKFSSESPRKSPKRAQAPGDQRPPRFRPKPADADAGRPPRKQAFRKFDSDAKPRKGKSAPTRGTREQIAAPVQTTQIRLNRYIANSGVCSRREADELITMGLISVNGKTVTELGFKVNPGDEVRYEDRVLRAEKPVYILLNKPKGYLTTTNDPQERNTVMHIIGDAVRERVYPVGRLDRNTTGLLLLTNDGDLADKLMHPSYNVRKIYKVELDRPLSRADFARIQEGVQLEEGKALVDDVAIVSEDGKTVGLELHIGWNRVVRRLFEALDYQVVKLDRSVYAGLDKKDLPRGHWRFLRKEEIIRLKHYK